MLAKYLTITPNNACVPVTVFKLLYLAGLVDTSIVRTECHGIGLYLHAHRYVG